VRALDDTHTIKTAILHECRGALFSVNKKNYPPILGEGSLKLNTNECIMSSSDPVEVIERTLRNVIHDVLCSKFGPDWTNNEQVGLGTQWANDLTRKMKEDQGVDKTAVVYDIPLAYAEFSDLGRLLEKHETLLKPIFQDWDTLIVYYRSAESLRNRIKHHRDISPSQHALLVGIAGEIEDLANMWRIGTQLQVKRAVFQFKDLIQTSNKPEDQVLTQSTECIRQWRDRIWSTIKKTSLNLSKFQADETLYKYHLSGQHIEIMVSTAPDASPTYQIKDISYKGIHAQLRYSYGCQANLDEFLRNIGKPYYHIAYELVDKINIAALEQWSIERAGLTPSSSGSTNGELTGVEYSLLGGRLRVGAWKYSEGGGGRFHATYDNFPEGFWKAHTRLGPREIVGFMLGDITPKAMMHLVQLALSPYSAV